MASAGSNQAMRERGSTPHGICGLQSGNGRKGQHPAWHLRALIRQWGKGAAPRMASAGSNKAMGERGSTLHGICGLQSSNGEKGQHPAWHLRAPIAGKGAAPRMASAGSNQGIWKRGIIRMASAGSNQAMGERGSTPHGICGLQSGNGGKGQHPAWHLRAPIRQWGKGAAPRMAFAGSNQAMGERGSKPRVICGLQSGNVGKGQHPEWHLRAPIRQWGKGQHPEWHLRAPIRQWGKGAARRVSSADSNQAMWERGSTSNGICGLQSGNGGKGQHPAWHLRAPIRQWGERGSTPHGICGLQSGNGGKGQHPEWHLRAPIRQWGKGAAPRMASEGLNQALWERGSTPRDICGLQSGNGGKGQHPAWHLRAPIRQWVKGAAPRMASAGSNQAMGERGSTPRGICGLQSGNGGKGQHPAWHMRAPIRQWVKGAAPRMASAGSNQAMGERGSTPRVICGLQSGNVGKGQHPAWHLRAPIRQWGERGSTPHGICEREGDVAQWVERLTAKSVMMRNQLFQYEVFREIYVFFHTCD